MIPKAASQGARSLFVGNWGEFRTATSIAMVLGCPPCLKEFGVVFSRKNASSSGRQIFQKFPTILGGPIHPYEYGQHQAGTVTISETNSTLHPENGWWVQTIVFF